MCQFSNQNVIDKSEIVHKSEFFYDIILLTYRMLSYTEWGNEYDFPGSVK